MSSLKRFPEKTPVGLLEINHMAYVGPTSA